MSEPQDRKDRDQGENQPANLNPGQSDGSDVMSGGQGRASGSSDAVSSSDLGPDTSMSPRQPDGGEVY
ncbi:MAG: hypothetical protein ACJ74G_02740 [Blastocatellia bacterium]